MTLKRSSGASRSRASASASRAWRIDVPAIEPEVSSTKITSRGSRFLAVAAVGISMSSA